MYFLFIHVIMPWLKYYMETCFQTYFTLKAQTNLVYVYYLLYLGVFNHAGPLCLLNCLKGRPIDRTCCDWSDWLWWSVNEDEWPTNQLYLLYSTVPRFDIVSVLNYRIKFCNIVTDAKCPRMPWVILLPINNNKNR